MMIIGTHMHTANKRNTLCNNKQFFLKNMAQNFVGSRFQNKEDTDPDISEQSTQVAQEKKLNKC